jgi:hypothetical protein
MSYKNKKSDFTLSCISGCIAGDYVCASAVVVLSQAAYLEIGRKVLTARAMARLQAIITDYSKRPSRRMSHAGAGTQEAPPLQRPPWTTSPPITHALSAENSLQLVHRAVMTSTKILVIKAC